MWPPGLRLAPSGGAHLGAFPEQHGVRQTFHRDCQHLKQSQPPPLRSGTWPVLCSLKGQACNSQLLFIIFFLFT